MTKKRHSYSAATRQRVRTLYVFDCLPLAQIEKMDAIPPVQTLYRWKRDALKTGDDWDKVRDAHLIAGKGANNVANIALTSLMILTKVTIERVNAVDEAGELMLNPMDATKAIASLTDSLHKVMAASKKLLPETSELVVAMEVIQEFSQFLQEKHKKILPQFVDVLSEFGAIIEKKYGG